MIKLVKQGDYYLIETIKMTKILLIDGASFVWINAKGVGEILAFSHKKHLTDYILAVGKYRLYKVEKEPNLTDKWHLELSVGEGLWQGYLLPSGLPDNKKKRNRIIPIKELITVVRSSMLNSLTK